MSDLSDLYQEVILDHNRAPRNYGALAAPTHAADGNNPLCGDRLSLSLEIGDDRVVAIAFEAAGCAISRASASLMTEAVRGRSLEEVGQLADRVHAMLAGPEGPIDDTAVGKLVVLSGLRRFPMRVKCATLAWHTLKAALADKGVGSRSREARPDPL